MEKLQVKPRDIYGSFRIPLSPVEREKARVKSDQEIRNRHLSEEAEMYEDIKQYLGV